MIQFPSSNNTKTSDILGDPSLASYATGLVVVYLSLSPAVSRNKGKVSPLSRFPYDHRLFVTP